VVTPLLPDTLNLLDQLVDEPPSVATDA